MEVDTDHMEVNIVQNQAVVKNDGTMVLIARIPFREINKVIC